VSIKDEVSYTDDGFEAIAYFDHEKSVMKIS
jgi:hypothetical protein